MALKNLQTLELGGARVTEHGAVARVCRDEDRDRLLILLEDGTILVHAADGTQVLDGVCLPGGDVTAWAWAPDKQGILFGTRAGELSMVNLLDQGRGTVEAEVEEVGWLEGGVLAAAWSPDEARLAVVTGSNRLLLMSEDWVPLAEMAVDDSTHTIGSAAIEWRADGVCFATATAAEESATHVLAIWDGQKGELEARGEPTPGLTSVLSWQPNGRHLYAVQSKSLAAHDAAQTAAAEASDVVPAATPTASVGDAAATTKTAPLSKHVAAWKREERRRAAAAAAAQTAAGGTSSHAVLLFERNGLRHGSWDVPSLRAEPGTERVVAAEWSPGSDMLALTVETGNTEEPGSQQATDSGPVCAVQLWTRHNWHWYCKSERVHYNKRAAALRWTSRGTLATVTRCGLVLTQRLAWAHDSSPLGTVAVVDHARLRLTPLRLAGPPPPMSSATAHLSAAVLCCSLRSSPGRAEAAAALLADGSLAICLARRDDDWGDGPTGAGEDAQPSVCVGEKLQLSTPIDKHAARFCSSDEPATSICPAVPAHMAAWVKACTWLDDEHILLVMAPSDVAVQPGLKSTVGPDLGAVFRIVQTAGEAVRVERVVAGTGEDECLPLPGTVLDCRTGMLALDDGRLFAVDVRADAEVSSPPLLHCTPMGAFPSPCAVLVPGPGALPGPRSRLLSDVPAAFGLSPRGELCVAGRVKPLATGVTSVVLRADSSQAPWLLYTDRSDGLTCVRSDRLESAPPLALQRRAVERGAELAAAPLGRDYCVLTLPRGNLERVHPRALSLQALARLCAARKWAAALHYALERRVDLNVLVDVAWPRFLVSAAQMLADVADDTTVADLLSSLRPGSVLEPGGVYAGCDAFEPSTSDDIDRGETEDGATAGLEKGPPAGEGKVEAVCIAIREAIEAGPGVKYLRTLLISHARCGDLEAALHLLKRIKDAEAGAGFDGAGIDRVGGGDDDACASMPTPSAETGLRHLLLSSSEDELYRAALGMYELDLAYFVVAHSQKDPGEYLQELASFAAVTPGPRRRAAIDEHLGRHSSALASLVAADADDCFDRALGLAGRHGLLRTLCALCPEGSARRAAALAALGARLAEAGRHEDAGLALAAAGARDAALEAYVTGGHWRAALAMAAELGRDAAELRQLAGDLADDLAGRGRPGEAAALRLEYGKDVDAAVALLAAAGEWREGWRIARTHRRGDLVDRVLAPSVARRAGEVLADAQEGVARVAKYRERLEHLATRRRDLAAAVRGAEDDGGEGDDFGGLDAGGDDAASTCSVVSGLSAYTDATTAGTAAPSTRSATSAASTLGGRRRQSAKSRRKAATNRVRQGSPEEEDQLARVLLSLAPSQGLCTEVGQLTELLVMLGHERDARLLQQTMGELVAVQAAAATAVLASPPPGMRDPERPDKPSDELRLQVLQQATESKTAAWKWDLLRVPEA